MMDVDIEALQCIHNILTVAIFVVFGIICVLVNKYCNMSWMGGGKNSNCTCKKTVYQGEITPSNNFIIRTPGQAPYKVPFYNFLEQSTCDTDGAINGYRSASCEKCCTLNSGGNDSCTSMDQILILHKAKSDAREVETESSRASLLTHESITEHTISVKLKYFDNRSEDADSEVSRDNSDVTFDEQGTVVDRNENKKYIVTQKPEKKLYTQKQSPSAFVQSSNFEESDVYIPRQNNLDESQIIPNVLTLKEKPTRDTSVPIKTTTALENSKTKIVKIPTKINKNDDESQLFDSNKDRPKSEKDNVHQGYKITPLQKYNTSTAEQNAPSSNQNITNREKNHISSDYNGSSIIEDNSKPEAIQDKISYERGGKWKNHVDKSSRFEHTSPDHSFGKKESTIRPNNENKTKLPETKRDSSSRGRARGTVPRGNDNELLKPGLKTITSVKPMTRNESPTRLTTDDKKSDKHNLFAKYSPPLQSLKKEKSPIRLVAPVKPMKRYQSPERKTTVSTDSEDKTVQSAETKRRESIVREEFQDNSRQASDKHVEDKTVQSAETKRRESIDRKEFQDKSRQASDKHVEDKTVQSAETKRRESIVRKEFQDKSRQASDKHVEDKTVQSAETKRGESIVRQEFQDKSRQASDKHVVSVRVKRKEETPTKIVLEDLIDQEASREIISVSKDCAQPHTGRSSPINSIKVDERSKRISSREIEEDRSPRTTLDGLFASSKKIDDMSYQTIDMGLKDNTSHGVATKNLFNVKVKSRGESPVRIVLEDITIPESVNIESSRRSDSLPDENVKQTDIRNTRSRRPSPQRLTLDKLFSLPTADCGMKSQIIIRSSSQNKSSLPKLERDIPSREKNGTITHDNLSNKSGIKDGSPARIISRDKTNQSDVERVSPSCAKFIKNFDDELLLSDMILSDESISDFMKQDQKSSTPVTPLRQEKSPTYKKLEENTAFGKTKQDHPSYITDIPLRGRKRSYDEDSISEGVSPKRKNLISDSKESLSSIKTSDNGIKRKHWSRPRERKNANDAKYNSSKLKDKASDETSLNICKDTCGKLNEKLYNKKIPYKNQPDSSDSFSNDSINDNKSSLDEIIQRHSEDDGYACDSDCDGLSDSEKNRQRINTSPRLGNPSKILPCKKLVGNKIDETDFKDASYSRLRQDYKRNYNKLMEGRKKITVTQKATSEKSKKYRVRTRSPTPEDTLNVYKVSPKLTITSRGKTSIENLTNTDDETPPLLRIRINNKDSEEKYVTSSCIREPVDTNSAKSKCLEKPCIKAIDTDKSPWESVQEYLNRMRRENIIPNTSLALDLKTPESSNTQPTSEEDISDIVSKYQRPENKTKSRNRTCTFREQSLKYPRQKLIESDGAFRYNSSKPSSSQQTDCPQFYPYRNCTPRRPSTYSQPAVIPNENFSRRRPVYSACSSRTPYCPPVKYCYPPPNVPQPKRLAKNICIISSQEPASSYNYYRKPVRFCTASNVLPTPSRICYKYNRS